MDKTTDYRDMCHTVVLQESWKPEYGDFVWSGDSLKVLSYDFIEVKDHFRYGYDRHFYVAMPSDITPFTMESSLDRVVMRREEYVIHNIYNPVWVPRIDQWLDMVKNFPCLWDKTILRGAVRMFDQTSLTLEKCLCLHVFRVLHDIAWNEKNRKWEQAF